MAAGWVLASPPPAAAAWRRRLRRQRQQQRGAALHPEFGVLRARLHVACDHERRPLAGARADGVHVERAAVDSLRALLLALGGLEVDDGHRAEELHRHRVGEAALLEVPARALEVDALDVGALL